MVDVFSRFVCAGQHSSLASLGEGGLVKERCNLKCNHLMSLFPLKIFRYYTL